MDAFVCVAVMRPKGKLDENPSQCDVNEAIIDYDPHSWLHSPRFPLVLTFISFPHQFGLCSDGSKKKDCIVSFPLFFIHVVGVQVASSALYKASATGSVRLYVLCWFDCANKMTNVSGAVPPDTQHTSSSVAEWYLSISPRSYLSWGPISQQLANGFTCYSVNLRVPSEMQNDTNDLSVFLSMQSWQQSRWSEAWGNSLKISSGRTQVCVSHLLWKEKDNPPSCCGDISVWSQMLQSFTVMWGVSWQEVGDFIIHWL